MSDPKTRLSARAEPYYYIIEAAIEWSELSEDGARAFRRDVRAMPSPLELPPPSYLQRPDTYNRMALLLQAMKSGELPCGLYGEPVNGHLPPDADLAWITVGRGALKDWITHNFPNEKPAFLFSTTEHAPDLSYRSEKGYLAVIAALAYALADCRTELHKDGSPFVGYSKDTGDAGIVGYLKQNNYTERSSTDLEKKISAALKQAALS